MFLPFRVNPFLYTFPALAAFAGCVSGLHPDFTREESWAFPKNHQTQLARLVLPSVTAHAPLSGLSVLESGTEAFLSRVALARSSQQSIDVQTYLIDVDDTGHFFLRELLHAADRGVRVRLLLDDFHAAGSDADAANLDVHPNIEIRLFNPFGQRYAFLRMFQTRLDFEKFNHRMHNKTFLADSTFAVVGGRNIGNSYFDGQSGLNFGDLDLIAAGPVVREAVSSFDEYWNSPWSIPVTAIRDIHPTLKNLTALRGRLDKDLLRVSDQALFRSVHSLEPFRWIEKEFSQFTWAPAQAVYDRPTKIIRKRSSTSLPHWGAELTPLVENVQRELTVISPYFVPGPEGVTIFLRLRKKGVRVRVLTNSLAATDVVAVHSGYAAYRKALVAHGVELFELQPAARLRKKHWWNRRKKVHASLHGKAMIFDGRTVLIGSMNLDHRSAQINTELGLLVESREIARQIEDLFSETTAPSNSYRLACHEPAGSRGAPPCDFGLVWIGAEQGKEVRYFSEPKAGFWRRFKNDFFSILDIEEHL